MRSGDGADVATILARMGIDRGAQGRVVASGRVFVGVRRVRSAEEAVHVGDVVRVSKPPEPPPKVSAPATLVVYDGHGIVVGRKPPGVPTIADHAGVEHAFVTQLEDATGRPRGALHATSRLDRDVSGVVAFAATKAAAAALARAREEHAYVRRYVALAVPVAGPSGSASSPALWSEAVEAERAAPLLWQAPIGRTKDPRHREVNGRDAAPAVTWCAVVASTAYAAMLALAPVTGRTHQLRVHASHAGMPLLGDRTYGGPTRLTLKTGRVLPIDRVALHARWVELPVAGSARRFEAEVPPELAALWRALGGDDAAWDTAAACALPDR